MKIGQKERAPGEALFCRLTSNAGKQSINKNNIVISKKRRHHTPKGVIYVS